MTTGNRVANDHIASIIRSKMPSAKAEDFIRYGTRKGKQVYLHKPSGKRFVANDALPGRRIPAKVVGDAIAAFYDGLSYRDIQRRIQVNHGFTPSTATLYEWNRDYINRATRLMENFKASTGDTWVGDEMMVRIDGKNVWIWNVMDRNTRYLLATHISPTRTIKDAETLFRQAKARSSRTPEKVITDGLAAYQEGIERVFGGHTKHLVSQGIRSTELNNNMSERLQGTIRERTKVMRGLETKRTAEIVMDGFRLHYNHMRPHHGLRGRTPAQAAGLPIVFKDWTEVATLQDDQIDALKDRTLQTQPLSEKRLRSRMPRSSVFSIRRARGF